MSLKSLSNLKKTAVSKKATPAKRSLKSLNSEVADVEELEDDIEEEAVAKKTIKKLAAKKKVAPAVEELEEDEDELEDDELEDEDELEDDEATEEDDEAEFDDELEDEDELEDDELEEEPVVAKKAPAKKKAAPVAKKAASVAKKAAPVKKAAAKKAPVKKAAPVAKSSTAPANSLFAKKTLAAKPLVEGAVMSRDNLIDLFIEELTIKHGFAPSKKEVTDTFKLFEDTILNQVFPKYSLNLFGVKFKRKVVEPRIYSGAGGLSVAVETDTEVSEHVKVTGSIYLGKESRKGIVDEDGEFQPIDE